MTDDPRDRRIASHIEAISARVELDTERLLVTMLQRCWPGDTGDRTAPCALEWVRIWGPLGSGCLPPACSCSTGSCRVCN